jgi:hypothetical protein
MFSFGTAGGRAIFLPDCNSSERGGALAMVELEGSLRLKK